MVSQDVDSLGKRGDLSDANELKKRNLVSAVEDLAGLEAEFQKAVLCEVNLISLTTLGKAVESSRRSLFHAEVFGATDVSATLEKAQGWLKKQIGRDMNSDQKLIVAGAIQWLRTDCGFKVFLESGDYTGTCLVTTEYRKDREIRRFQLWESGGGNRKIVSPMLLPAGLSFEK